jgi:hypothetical protein
MAVAMAAMAKTVKAVKMAGVTTVEMTVGAQAMAVMAKARDPRKR